MEGKKFILEWNDVTTDPPSIQGQHFPNLDVIYEKLANLVKYMKSLENGKNACFAALFLLSTNKCRRYLNILPFSDEHRLELIPDIRVNSKLLADLLKVRIWSTRISLVIKKIAITFCENCFV
jgi:hypothetical protein